MVRAGGIAQRAHFAWHAGVGYARRRTRKGVDGMNRWVAIAAICMAVAARGQDALECYPDCRGAGLRRADLSDADLYAVDLRGADLREALLEGTNLYGADLFTANLLEARVV